MAFALWAASPPSAAAATVTCVWDKGDDGFWTTELDQFSPEIRRSFQAAAYQNEADSSHRDELVDDAQQWLQSHIAKPVSIGDLAKKLKLSPRTLNRRFRRATGMTPLAYLQSLRIANAKDLLRHSNLSVGDIAWQIGLHDVSYFSQLFKRHSGISPLQYREAVRGKLFDPGPL